MKATAPVHLTNTPAPVNPPAATAPAATLDSAADFVGMLMQLLGGTAATTAVLPGAAGRAQTEDLADAETDDPDALAAMLALPIALPLPWAALPAALPEGGTDPLELLGLGAGGKNPAASLLTADAGLDVEAPDAGSGDVNDSIGSLSPFNETLHARSTAAESLAARPLHSPVGTQQWADELGTRLTWMVDRGQQTASLRLSPENLGPLEVRISITDDKASVWFGAAHADTRAAIEHALPRLREMFSAQGLSLTDAGVFREPPRDQSTAAPRNFAADPQAGQQEGEVMISTRGTGILDAYA